MVPSSLLLVTACVAALLTTSGSVAAQGPKPAPGAKAKPGLSSAPKAGRIYKWTDDKGVTHYGAFIPTEYRDQAANEMTKQGLTVRKIEPTATPEQRKMLEERLEQEREGKKRAFEQRRQDLALMHTYSSAAEIEVARERNLALPQQVMKGLEPRLLKAQERLNEALGRAEKLSNSGRPVPEGMQEDIEGHKLDFDALIAERNRHHAQIEAIKERFDTARQRYVELTQGTASR